MAGFFGNALLLNGTVYSHGHRLAALVLNEEGPAADGPAHAQGCGHVARQHRGGVAVNIGRVSVYRVLQRDHPVHRPATPPGEDQHLRIEELGGHVLLYRGKLSLAHPDEHHVSERPGRVYAGSHLAGYPGIGAFGQHGHALARLIKSPAVVWAGDGAGEVAVAVGEGAAPVGAHVPDRFDLAILPTEEGDLLTQELHPHRLLAAHLLLR